MIPQHLVLMDIRALSEALISTFRPLPSRGGMNVTTYAVVGKPVTREDGPEKVSGRTCYSGDLMLPGMLWGKVLRSPFPHARIVHIDTSGASKLPGVHAVLTV